MKKLNGEGPWSTEGRIKGEREVREMKRGTFGEELAKYVFPKKTKKAACTQIIDAALGVAEERPHQGKLLRGLCFRGVGGFNTREKR